ncbi:winged helix-turn-helix transcriptional regulator [Nocardioides nitrophenolicus]|uniref:winged helix-turn-helix transcriptional regulator n=1 Tax=Nocardioides nitrophenolicus TaxID=60489 RepID=UPI00195745E0|nr:helix-turn-helix domain-containing protein [Nocardioides nitrophenolicus]MBM7520368.1 DNA-binding HxlR family transcriptional regulator [Nocardioides nitrophenolicus]
MSRSYGHYCGLARALDVVGDRWNLLVVRQLLMGPARYRELLDGLPGVATNLLSDRLRDLEAAGVVERRPAETGSAVVYALTPWGGELRGPIQGLIRWSTPLMVSGPGDDPFHPEWLAVALPALLDVVRPPGESPTVGLAVDDQVFQVRATESGLEVARHDGRPLDAVLRADPMVVLGLAAGVLGLDDVRESVALEGDEGAVRAIFAR